MKPKNESKEVKSKQVLGAKNYENFGKFLTCVER